MSQLLKRTTRVEVPAAQRATLLEFALKTVEAAGKEILPSFRQPLDVDNKLSGGQFDPVTEADRRGETVIREAIGKAYPEHGILGEEFGHQEGNGLTWIIDPIDGTRAFMTGMLHWGVLLALFDGQEPVLGVLHQPYTGEFFFGDNATAHHRRSGSSKRLRVRSCSPLSDAVLATTTPEFFPGAEDLAALRLLESKVKLTRYGGDCYLFAMLAMGLVDIALEAALNPYDIQPLIPIIRGAGGVVTNWKGEDASLSPHVLACGDPALHAHILDLLS